MFLIKSWTLIFLLWDFYGDTMSILMFCDLKCTLRHAGKIHCDISIGIKHSIF